MSSTTFSKILQAPLKSETETNLTLQITNDIIRVQFVKSYA